MTVKFKTEIPFTDLAIEHHINRQTYPFGDLYQVFKKGFTFPVSEFRYDAVERETGINPFYESVNGNYFLGFEAAEVAAIKFARK